MSRKKTKNNLSEQERLQIICESIKFAKTMESLRAPRRTFSKSVREPIFFLWEAYNGGKYQSAHFRSIKSKGVESGGRRLVYDHSIPFKYVLEKLMELKEIKTSEVKQILERYCVTCVITAEEDKELSRRGYASKMPDENDFSEPLIRYKMAGIKVEPNIE